MIRKYFIAAIIFSLLSGASYAKSAGVSSAEFLKIAVGARPVGMGEAYAAMARGAEAAYWNPAGLADQKMVEVLSMYSDWFADTSFQYAGVVVPSKQFGPVGISYSLFNYGNIPGYDSSGARTADVLAGDSAITLSIARNIRKNLNAGINVKYINESLDSINATTFAFDAGVLLALRPDVHLAMVAKNQLGSLKFISSEAYTPGEITIGVAASGFRVDGLNLAADYTFTSSEDNYLNLGAEYYFTDFFALRLGSSKNRLQGGLGFWAPAFRLDYAYVPYENLGPTHRVSFTLRFGIDKAEELSRLYKQGKDLYRKKRYLDALVIFKKVLELDPASRDGQEFVDRIVEEMRQETLQQKVRAMIEQKKRASDLLEQAIVAFQENDYTKALDLIEESLQYAPNNGKALQLKERIDKIINIEKKKR